MGDDQLHSAGGCLWITAFLAPFRATLPQSLPGSAGQFAVWLWKKSKRARSPLLCSKTLFAHLEGSPDLPSPCCRSWKAQEYHVCVLLFDIFKLSCPTSTQVFTSFYTSLKELVITQDWGAMGKVDRESQSGGGWKRPMRIIQYNSPAGSPRAGCTGSRPARFWESPEKESPQPHFEREEQYL